MLTAIVSVERGGGHHVKLPLVEIQRINSLLLVVSKESEDVNFSLALRFSGKGSGFRVPGQSCGGC